MTLEDKVHAFRLRLFRRAEELGNIPPVELEQMYYERQEAPAMGVGLN